MDALLDVAPAGLQERVVNAVQGLEGVLPPNVSGSGKPETEFQMSRSPCLARPALNKHAISTLSSNALAKLFPRM